MKRLFGCGSCLGSRLQQIYDKHDYLRERRRALLALNAELDRIFDKRPIPMDLDAVELKRFRALVKLMGRQAGFARPGG